MKKFLEGANPIQLTVQTCIIILRRFLQELETSQKSFPCLDSVLESFIASLEKNKWKKCFGQIGLDKAFALYLLINTWDI